MHITSTHFFGSFTSWLVLIVTLHLDNPLLRINGVISDLIYVTLSAHVSRGLAKLTALYKCMTIKAGLHGQFYLPAPCLPSTANKNRRGVYTTDM